MEMTYSLGCIWSVNSWKWRLQD